eukprot:CAMPEP_0118981140 /NCGR_PEP_ID=MMETSP1173-20130426/29924_1 /TAXON_ID=1034831 /ORGANISM="Rhizochromulina marina cf, Strain CCMP1243" /LENGTH=75 /DNA_ID=CAMNT_0006931539 /DNA_START=122 /DNA_END=350 /DNA_ORIENTATION=+
MADDDEFIAMYSAAADDNVTPPPLTTTNDDDEACPVSCLTTSVGCSAGSASSLPRLHTHHHSMPGKNLRWSMGRS